MHARRTPPSLLHVGRDPSIIGLLRRRGGVVVLPHGRCAAEPTRLAADRPYIEDGWIYRKEEPEVWRRWEARRWMGVSGSEGGGRAWRVCSSEGDGDGVRN